MEDSIKENTDFQIFKEPLRDLKEKQVKKLKSDSDEQKPTKGKGIMLNGCKEKEKRNSNTREKESKHAELNEKSSNPNVQKKDKDDKEDDSGFKMNVSRGSGISQGF